MCVSNCFHNFGMAKFWLGFVALADVGISSWILLASFYAWINLKEAMTALSINRLSSAKPFIWSAVILIPLAALATIWNAKKMWTTRNSKDSCYQLIKAFIFIFGEGVFILLPYYLSEDCAKAIDLLLDNMSSTYMVLNLTTINIFTGLMYTYELFSCVVVWVHKGRLRAEDLIPSEYPIPRPRRSGHQVAMLPDDHQLGSSSQQSGLQQEESLPAYAYVNELSQSPTSPTYQNMNTIAMNSGTTGVKRTHNSRPVIPNTKAVANVTATTSKTVNETSGALGEEKPLDLNTHTEITSDLTQHNVNGSVPKYQFLKKCCLKRGILFEDMGFPTEARSIQFAGMSDVVWKRPYEITKNAKFIVKGKDRFDVMQGEIGNCWFVAALASATTLPEIMDKVIPEDNDWLEHGGYCGLFHFRLYVASHWEEVIIDDRLPTRDNELVFMRSTDKNEFWSSLLEKAYAKFKGSYGSLNGGFIRTGFMNLTGGLVEEIQLDDAQVTANLFTTIETALGKNSLIGCSIGEGNARRNKKCGLVSGHAYSITAIDTIYVGDDRKEVIIRIRNPWGNETEWNGEFSDNHPLWRKVDKKTRLELELIFEKNGEFWFPLKIFTEYFDLLAICYFENK